MSYDFSRIVDRYGTDCLKFDAALQRKGRDDLRRARETWVKSGREIMNV